MRWYYSPGWLRKIRCFQGILTSIFTIWSQQIIAIKLGIRRWTLEISNFFLPRPIRLKLSANLSHRLWNHYEWKFWLSTPSEWFKTAGGQNSWFCDKTSCMAIIGIKLIVMIRRLHFRSSWVIWMTSCTNYDVMNGDSFARKFHKIVIKLNCGFFFRKWLEWLNFL